MALAVTLNGWERKRLARALAGALLAGEPELDAACARAAETLGREWGWVRPLARRYLAGFAGEVRPRQAEVAAFLEQSRRFQWACGRFAGELRLSPIHWMTEAPRMLPMEAAVAWGVPAIATEAELAEWLRLNPTELEWFADLKTLGRWRGSSEAVRHYRYGWVAKRSGAVRLIEAPKGRMKALQRQILAEILNRVPTHPAVHGFVRGRSIVTFAAPHAGQEIVLRLDLKDFFPSIRRARVQSIFRMLGYPDRVADLLGGICTNVVPGTVLRGMPPETRELYGETHLPQGAATSPALANLCAYRLDCRLAGLAKAAGGVYTRYADDLAFSGTGAFARGTDRFAGGVRAIAAAEGFAINQAKTRVMGQGVRQRLAGVVVNQRVNGAREDFDRLKAILTNCIKNGAAAENREGLPFWREHLEGKVSFMAMLNPQRGAKLKGMLERISWE